MGLFDFNKRSKSAINKDRKYFNANEPHEVSYAKSSKRRKKTYNTFDNGGGVGDSGAIYSLAENMSNTEYDEKYSKLSEKQKDKVNTLIRLGDTPKLALATILLSKDSDENSDTWNLYRYSNGGGVGVAKISKKGKTVTLQSGMKGNRNLLQNRYDSFEEFEAICDIYRLHITLGYDTPEEAWIDNPIIESGVIPSDFRKVNKYKHGGGVGKAYTKYPKFRYDYGGQLTDEKMVIDNLRDGEIYSEILTEIIGNKPNYPHQFVGSIKLEKCFLRPYYRIVN